MKSKRWKPVLPVLALPLFAAASLAQTTGVSHPDDSDATVQTTTAPGASDHYVMPARAGAPASTSGAPARQAYPAQGASSYNGEAVAYAATGPAPVAQTAEPGPVLLPRQPASTLPPTPGTEAPVQTANVRPERAPGTSESDDSGIVTEVPAGPYELPAGTVLKARLDVALGTNGTPVGAPFTAQLLADAGHDGTVLLPSGTVIHGRVTAAHGGRRITGGAALRLQPQTVTLPDGNSYPLLATLADVEGSEIVHVNSEGTVQGKTNAKETVAVIGGVTGVAAIAGALVGGGVGAVVGAGIGAGVGAIVWLKQDNQAHLPAGSTLYFTLGEPLQLNPR